MVVVDTSNDNQWRKVYDTPYKKEAKKNHHCEFRIRLIQFQNRLNFSLVVNDSSRFVLNFEIRGIKV
jgi:hypothetical protein